MAVTVGLGRPGTIKERSIQEAIDDWYAAWGLWYLCTPRQGIEPLSEENFDALVGEEA